MTTSTLEQTFATRLQQLAPDLPTPFTEYVFAAPRKWRFDVAWPDYRVAVELEGGVWSAGRHTRPQGFEDDAAKYNRASELGWRVLRFTAKALDSDPDACIQQVRAMLTETTLPALTTPKYTVDDFGLHITGDLTYDEWVACGAVIWQWRNAIQWSIGDWVAYGEDHFSDDSAQALTLTEYSAQTVANYASVSRVFPPERRVYRLSHSHYDAARGLRDSEGRPDKAAQDNVLAQAVKEEWSREDVREFVRDVVTKRKSTSGGNDDPPALPHGGNDDVIEGDLVDDAPPAHEDEQTQRILDDAEHVAFILSIAELNVDELGPIEGLTKLYELRRMARKLIGLS